MHNSKETEYELTRDFLNLLEVMHRIEDDSEAKSIYPVGGDEGGRPVNYDFCFEFDRHGNFIGLKKEKVNLTLHGELEEGSYDDKIEVPQWFDEWCKGRAWGDKFHEGRQFTRSDVRALVQIADGESLHGLTQEQSDEISRDFFKYLDAFHYGYEVEEEKKFYVMNNDNRMMLVRRMMNAITEADPIPFDELYDTEKKSYRLTEQEVKDYDPRYWPFRKPVEEVEENEEN